jgi:nucleoprotein TPR
MSKSEEFSKYRRAKHAEHTELQASYDSLTQTHASTTASLKTLQSAHTAQSHQLTQALTRVQDLTGQLAESDATYTSEVGGLKRLVKMMEDRERAAKEVVDGVEKEYARVGERAERRERDLLDEVERERRAREDVEKRLEQLETVFHRMDSGELPMPGRGRQATPVRGGNLADGDTVMQGMMGLSPTVAMVSRAQRSGKTFTEVYADYVRLEDELAQKTVEYDRMERTLNDVLRQIEERVCWFPFFTVASC